jgi:prevent-host-death family protein
METNVSVRDLRNRTAQVLDEVEAGDTVYITRNGERVAVLTSLTSARHPANARLLAYLDARRPVDNGSLLAYLESKRLDLIAENERDDRIGLP